MWTKNDKAAVADLPVRRDEEGRKMYPGRFWEWPYPDGPIVLATEDEVMEYSVAVWTNTEDTMPSVKQLKYLLYLLDSRDAEPETVDWSSKRQLARVINWLCQQPLKPGKTDTNPRFRNG